MGDTNHIISKDCSVCVKGYAMMRTANRCGRVLRMIRREKVTPVKTMANNRQNGVKSYCTLQAVAAVVGD